MLITLGTIIFHSVFSSGYDNKDGTLENVILPKSLKMLGEGSFINTDIKSIVIPKGVTEIGKYTFADCIYLETVNLEGKVTSIWEEAFLRCENLKNIQLPGTVTNIE